MSIISCIYWTIRRFIWNLFCWKISDILEKVIWRQYATPKSNNGIGLSNLWPHFNLHTSIQCPSRLPHKPCDATEHTGQELQEFYWQWKSHFYCHSDKSGQFFFCKKSPTFHTKTGKYLDLFSIVCSNKILMCLSCLRQLPGGKFDHFKSEN